MKALIMCNRVGEQSHRPIPGQVIRQCQDCGHDVLISPATIKSMLGYPDHFFCCVECGVKRIPPEGIPVDVSEEQKEEVRAAGYDPTLLDGAWLQRRGFRK
jgi:hypothetical protein